MGAVHCGEIGRPQPLFVLVGTGISLACFCGSAEVEGCLGRLSAKSRMVKLKAALLGGVKTEGRACRPGAADHYYDDYVIEMVVK